MAKRKWIAKKPKEEEGKAKPESEMGMKGRAHKLFGKKPMVRR